MTNEDFVCVHKGSCWRKGLQALLRAYRRWKPDAVWRAGVPRGWRRSHVRWAACFFVFAVGACRPSSPGSDAREGAAVFAAALEGRWQRCELGEVAGSRTWFEDYGHDDGSSNGAHAYWVAQYADSTCSSDGMVEWGRSGAFRVGGPVAASFGPGGPVVIAHELDLIDRMNVYTIAYVELATSVASADRLYLGVPTSGLPSTPESRPTVLDTGSFVTRVQRAGPPPTSP